MKKYLKSAVFVLFILFLFISCGDFFTQKNLSKPEGLITLSFRSQTEYLEGQSLARTASPEKDKSYKDVKKLDCYF